MGLVQTYERTDRRDLFQKKNDKGRVTIGSQANDMTPIVAIPDTGAGPNQIRKCAVCHDWYIPIEPVQDPGLTAATTQTVDVQSVVLLHVRIVSLFVRLCSGVTTRVAVALLLWTSFLGCFSKASFPSERNVVPDNSRPVSMPDTFRTAANVIGDARKEATDTMDHDILFRASGLTKIPPKSQEPVLHHSKVSRLMYVVPHELVVNNHLAMTVPGVVDVVPNKSFLPARGQFLPGHINYL